MCGSFHQLSPEDGLLARRLRTIAEPRRRNWTRCRPSTTPYSATCAPSCPHKLQNAIFFECQPVNVGKDPIEESAAAGSPILNLNLQSPACMPCSCSALLSAKMETLMRASMPSLQISYVSPKMGAHARSLAPDLAHLLRLDSRLSNRIRSDSPCFPELQISYVSAKMGAHERSLAPDLAHLSRELGAGAGVGPGAQKSAAPPPPAEDAGDRQRRREAGGRRRGCRRGLWHGRHPHTRRRRRRQRALGVGTHAGRGEVLAQADVSGGAAAPVTRAGCGGQMIWQWTSDLAQREGRGGSPGRACGRGGRPNCS